ncbi:hypothetical protein M0R45_023567 [Rubus argutus]|uniref:PHD-type domain-containing protein n=1 Tax=Rubus argutus TaxID=59490 RepID=A0AAW1WN28_RUBAR
MGKMSSKESAIPWGWALEALVSSEEVAVSVLHVLIEKVVPHLPDDLRNSVNERVALRCLHDLFAPHDDAPPPPTQPSKLTLDFSETCQAVLKRIVNETPESDVSMGGGGKWKWDIQPFIQHKRASMPKLALQKLKESIVDGTHPYADLLRRKSGLTSARVAVTDRFNGSCSNAPEEEPNDESALPSKRGRIASDNTEKMAEANHSHDSDRNAKKTKIDASGVSARRDMLEDSSERGVPVSEGERCVSPCRMGMMEKSCALAEDLCDANSKHDGGFNPEPTISGVAPPHETQHKISAKEHMVFAQESGCNTEHDSHINITRPASADVSKKKTIADETKDLCHLDYVATEKRDFLSSKCSLNRYSHSKERDHCLMCNGGGQLLICSTSDCPLVYHESCMGSNFISYEKGNFYCPFCAYSLDLTEYLETEKEASRLRKDLHSFSCLLSKSSERAFGRDTRKSGEDFGK